MLCWIKLQRTSPEVLHGIMRERCVQKGSKWPCEHRRHDTVYQAMYLCHERKILQVKILFWRTNHKLYMSCSSLFFPSFFVSEKKEGKCKGLCKILLKKSWGCRAGRWRWAGSAHVRQMTERCVWGEYWGSDGTVTMLQVQKKKNIFFFKSEFYDRVVKSSIFVSFVLHHLSCPICKLWNIL